MQRKGLLKLRRHPLLLLLQLHLLQLLLPQLLQLLQLLVLLRLRLWRSNHQTSVL